MNKLLIISIIILSVFGLTGCTEEAGSDFLRQNVVEQIEFYIEANEYIDEINDESLEDVPESMNYTSEDFFNYDSKATQNVELEYGEYYETFNQLLFVKDAVESIDNFEYGTYFEDVGINQTVYVNVKNGLMNIEYFEYLVDLDIVIRHSYFLKTVNDEVHMEKYFEIYDCESEEVLIIKRFSVYGDRYIESFEYYPETYSFSYSYDSKENQEFFKYKGIMDNGNFIRQTVEYYIAPYNAYVSFDIKEDELEDYRVKIFKDGHRVVKIDVNVKSNNPTINELTWNLLSVYGWNHIENNLDDFLVYKNSSTVLDEYSIDVQLKGYGKVEAYKLFEGEMTEYDISLIDNGLNSGITLDMVNTAKLYFESNYVLEMNKYGFTVNDANNVFVIYNAVKPSLEVKQEFEEYIQRYK